MYSTAPSSPHKIGSGFKDDELDQHTQFMQSHVIDKPKSYYRHSDGVQPDQWFDSVQVCSSTLLYCSFLAGVFHHLVVL